MSAPRLLAMLAVASFLAVAPGDLPRPAGRLPAGLAAAVAVAAPVIPAFTLFGWVSPPPESTTATRVAEMAEAGLTLALPAIAATALEGRVEDNLARLDLLSAAGMQALVWDERFVVYDRLDPLSPAGIAHLDSILADYTGRPEVLGWYLGDEPPAGQFDLLGRLRDALAARDPDRIAWNNLLGRSAFPSRDAWLAHVRDYVARVRPAVLCDDHYDFLADGERGQFIENVAGLAAVAREAGVPFWLIVLVTQHDPYRTIDAGLMRWQAAQPLAYGARGIGWFTYWTPADPGAVWGPGLIARDGTRGPLFTAEAAFAPRLRAAGEVLSRLTWITTEHAGSCPSGGTPFAPDDWVSAVEGRAAFGCFADSAGTRYVVVANSDSASARTIALELPHARAAEVLGGSAGAWSPAPLSPGASGSRLALALEAGDFALVRAHGDFGLVRSGDGPGLHVWPVPASAVVRLSYQGLLAGGRLEVLDAAGRRVWHFTPPAGSGLVVWDGSRDDGGVAPPGVYLVRCEDARGVGAARLVWMGR